MYDAPLFGFTFFITCSTHQNGEAARSSLCASNHLQRQLRGVQFSSIIAGSAAAPVGIRRLDGASSCDASASPAQGSAPDGAPYTPRFFTDEQMITIDRLSELIIPEDSHSPGAHCARVCEYIDETVARTDQAEKDLWLNGISALDELSQTTGGRPFRECTHDQQRRVVEKLAAREEHPESLGDRFFVKAKRATINGYYTSQIGIHRELEYQGNSVLAEFPGCTHSGHQL